jgi:hypothetical protein
MWAAANLANAYWTGDYRRDCPLNLLHWHPGVDAQP